MIVKSLMTYTFSVLHLILNNNNHFVEPNYSKQSYLYPFHGTQKRIGRTPIGKHCIKKSQRIFSRIKFRDLLAKQFTYSLEKDINLKTIDCQKNNNF